MLVDDILRRNQDWARGRQPEPLPPVETIRLAVVGCYDPRLDQLLFDSLGLRPGQAFLLRSAGALLHPGSTTLRSLGLAILMFGVTEVLIVGHAACRMASFDTSEFIDEFRRRGLPREAFGDDTLRTWAGAIASPRQGVLQSVAAIAEARFVPADVRVWGAVLDETSGALEVIVRPDATAAPAAATPPVVPATPFDAGDGAGSSAAGAASSSTASAATSAADGARARRAAATDAAAERQAARHAGSSPTSRPGPPPAVAAVPPPPQPPPPPRAERASKPAPPPQLLAAADAFLTTIESKAHWRADLDNLRAELQRRRSPRQRLELIDAFARRLGTESGEVADSFARLRREIVAAGADPAAELLSVFHYLGRRR